MQLTLRCLLFWPLWLLHASYDVIPPQASHNLTAHLLARQRRHQLTFENGGTIRLVVGPVLPVLFGDKEPWRGLLYYYLLHFGQFVLPSAPLYPWDKWEKIFERSLKQQISALDESHEDDTRLFAYNALEHYMDRQGEGGAGLGSGVGRQCLLRGICENAQLHHHEGLVAELLQVLLTPGKARLADDYREAHAAGSAGVDCLSQYAECPRGRSLLDNFTVDY